MTQILFVEIISLILIPRKNQLMRKGLVVEQSTTPMNGSMEGLAEETENCQPEVPQSAVSCRPRLTRVPSDRRKRTGPEPSWGGKGCKNTHERRQEGDHAHRGGVTWICREKRGECMRLSSSEKKN
jgi:hypothetical protein